MFSSISSSEPAPAPVPLTPAQRARKQFTVMLGGCAFALISAVVARRAVIRRVNWSRPRYFQQNDMHPEQQVDGGLEALEALSVATVNVFSWGVLCTGGVMFATDTLGFVEARQKIRAALGVTGNTPKDAEVNLDRLLDAVKFWKTDAALPVDTTITPPSECPDPQTLPPVGPIHIKTPDTQPETEQKKPKSRFAFWSNQR